ncbi:RNA binding protein, heterogenous nuclear RNP-K like protein [Coemansia javaensis]|uniref:RNA binding protein, heterogenous nuclear RNP-K like protein n=1 Tax=Coemansia javaensis TaxID=2761396 RepID=A0A9W8HD92_9FUNG|nr:RNA binding protein, heterogenous nuclear RNP-K like protein [Coemansia javaensis]
MAARFGEAADGLRIAHITAAPQDEQGAPRLRLLFSCGDGGMLIGKGGCHIARLKESTSVSWVVTSNTSASVDRIVAIRGTPEDLAEAIRVLAEHIGEQSRAGARHTVLRFLFPTKSIGAILGPSGSHAERKRAELGIPWLHVHRDAIPFTQERIVEVGGSARTLSAAAAWMLRATMPALVQLQGSSTLYAPVEHGLDQLLLHERCAGSGDPRAGCAWLWRTGRGAPDQPHRQPRRACEGSSYRPRAERQRPRRSPPRSRSPQSRSPARSRSPRPRAKHSRDGKLTEKLVVPDSVAGRLIGRNGKGLAALEERSGARIVLSPRIESIADRVATVVGRRGEVRRACRLIRDSVRSFEDPGSP